MLGGLKKWFKQGIAYRNIDKLPAAATAAHVLRTKWLNFPEMTKDFSPEFVQSEATKILQEVMRILASDNPRLENRQALADLVVQYARLQVLVMDPEPIEDPTGFRGQPGITGEMKARIPELASLEPWLIPLEGIHKAFRHAVGLRTADRRMDRCQAQLPGNGMRLMRTVSPAIVAQEFQHDGACIDIAKPLFHRFNQHLAHRLAGQAATRPGTPGDDFAVTAILGKGAGDDLAVRAD